MPTFESPVVLAHYLYNRAVEPGMDSWERTVLAAAAADRALTEWRTYR